MGTSKKTYVGAVEAYRALRPTLDGSIEQAKQILASVDIAEDRERALALVLLGVRDGALDAAIAAVRDIALGNLTLEDSLRAMKYGRPR